jgi:hypothetical protein
LAPNAIAVGIMTPAFAPGGGGGLGIGTFRFPARVSPIFRSGRIGTPGAVAGLRGFQNDAFRRGAAFGNPGSAAIWPYPWLPIDMMQAALSEPQVIVISDSNYTQGRIAPAPGYPLNYSYVPGCGAILNGYHCEVTRLEALAP